MILEVASKLDDYESNSKNIVVNTSQLMKFNTVIYKIQTSSATCHSKKNKPFLSVQTG